MFFFLLAFGFFFLIDREKRYNVICMEEIPTSMRTLIIVAFMLRKCNQPSLHIEPFVRAWHPTAPVQR